MNYPGLVCAGDFTDTWIQELLGSSPCIAPCMLCFQCSVFKSLSTYASCHALYLVFLIYARCFTDLQCKYLHCFLADFPVWIIAKLKMPCF